MILHESILSRYPFSGVFLRLQLSLRLVIKWLSKYKIHCTNWLLRNARTDFSTLLHHLKFTHGLIITLIVVKIFIPMLWTYQRIMLESSCLWFLLLWKTIIFQKTFDKKSQWLYYVYTKFDQSFQKWRKKMFASSLLFSKPSKYALSLH